MGFSFFFFLLKGKKQREKRKGVEEKTRKGERKRMNHQPENNRKVLDGRNVTTTLIEIEIENLQN